MGRPFIFDGVPTLPVVSESREQRNGGVANGEALTRNLQRADLCDRVFGGKRRGGVKRRRVEEMKECKSNSRSGTGTTGFTQRA